MRDKSTMELKPEVPIWRTVAAGYRTGISVLVRDGALFRGRFTSRAVTSEAYWYTVLRYIDRNPVAAGLAREPTEYPHGSAWWYARRAGPAWLRRDVVEAAVSAMRLIRRSTGSSPTGI